LGKTASYRRHSLAEQREAYKIASAELAILKAKEDKIIADAEVCLNRLDLRVLQIKQKAAKASARKRFRPNT
jgi:hypothetical protein